MLENNEYCLKPSILGQTVKCFGWLDKQLRKAKAADQCNAALPDKLLQITLEKIQEEEKTMLTENKRHCLLSSITYARKKILEHIYISNQPKEHQTYSAILDFLKGISNSIVAFSCLQIAT